MAEVRLALLGPPIVESDGCPVGFDTRKAIALLALLALDGKGRARADLAAMLWPDSEERRARAALRRTLSTTTAGVGDVLDAGRDVVALVPARTRVDATDFRTLVAQDDADSLARAVRLYRGDFLSGFSLRGCPEFEEWQLFTGESLRLQMESALSRLVEMRVGLGQLEAAVQDARRWLAMDPLSEPAHQALIRLYAWTGRRSLALRQYRTCVRTLSRELKVAPLRETTVLYRDVLAERLAPPPRPKGRRQGRDGPARAESQVAAPVGPVAPVGPAAPVRPVAPVGPVGPAAPVRPAACDRGLSAPALLVGRAGELASLQAAWSSSAAGGALAGIAGEAGSGKTRLVEALSVLCQDAGASRVLVRCHESERPMAYAVAGEILRMAYASRPEAFRGLNVAEKVELSRLLPFLAPAAVPAPIAEGSAARARFFAAVADVVAAALEPVRGDAGEGPPGLLVVDDAQWADGASLELLAYLGRRAESLHGLLLVTWAPEAATGPGINDLTDVVRQSGGPVIALEPFGRAEVADVLADAGARGDPDWLLAETHGVPLLVVEYARALARGDLDPESSVGPPASVRRLLEAKVAAAGEVTVQTLSAMAILGRSSSLELLRAVSGRDESETVVAVEDALRRRLLVERPGRLGAVAEYDFPYSGLARTCYQRTTLARRRLLHSRAADALAHQADLRGTGTPGAIAWHLQEAGRDVEAAGWWWWAAQRSRSLSAHEEALAQLQSAQALGHPDHLVCEALGDVLTKLGRYPEALTAYERAAAGHEPGSPELAGIEHSLADVHHRLGDHASAEAHLAIALELVPAEDSRRRAALEADRSLVAYHGGDLVRSREHAERALSQALAGGDAATLAQALNVSGMLAADQGDLVAAEDDLTRAVERGRGLEDRGPLGAALNNLARVLEKAGRRGEALAVQREALAVGERHGDRHRIAALHTNLADLLHAEGDEEGAMEHLKVAARLFATVDAGARRPGIWTLVAW